MLEVAPGWKLDVTRGPDWLYVRLECGKTGWTDASGVADAIWDLLQRQFARRLVLELQDLEVLSSSLLGEMVRLYRRIENSGGMMRISGLTESNCEVLRMTRLEQCFPVYASREEAVMGVRRRPR